MATNPLIYHAENGKFVVKIFRNGLNFIFLGYYKGIAPEAGYKRPFLPSQVGWYKQAINYFLAMGSLPSFGDDIFGVIPTGCSTPTVILDNFTSAANA